MILFQDIGQNNTVKIVQKVADVKPPTLSVNLDTQRVSRHFPTFSHTLDTAPVAVVVGCSALISNISGDVKQNSNKMPRMPRRTARDVSGNQGRDPYIRDISGDKVAVGELDGQIIAVPSRRERANGNRERSDAFRTPLQSPTLYLKYCNKLLMAPKKRRFRRYFR